MTDERRYQDAEITEIFRAAAAADDSASGTPSSARGLTLAELQAIGLVASLILGRALGGLPLLGTALAAAMVPALRAARSDPMEALRSE